MPAKGYSMLATLTELLFFLPLYSPPRLFIPWRKRGAALENPFPVVDSPKAPLCLIAVPSVCPSSIGEKSSPCRSLRKHFRIVVYRFWYFVTPRDSTRFSKISRWEMTIYLLSATICERKKIFLGV